MRCPRVLTGGVLRVLLAVAATLAAGVLTGCSTATEAEPGAQTTQSAWRGCDSYSTQPQAQRAWQKIGRPEEADGDGDGQVCESLPAQDTPEDDASCQRTGQVVSVTYSRREYPNIARHAEQSIAQGSPTVLRVRRAGTDQRRDDLLEDVPTRDGFDRDEYPPAVGRATGDEATVRYVPSGENRSAGSILGNTLDPYCDGQRFRYRIVP